MKELRDVQIMISTEHVVTTERKLRVMEAIERFDPSVRWSDGRCPTKYLGYGEKRYTNYLQIDSNGIMTRSDAPWSGRKTITLREIRSLELVFPLPPVTIEHEGYVYVRKEKVS